MITNLSIDPTYICNENCVSCKCDKLSEVFRHLKSMSLEKYYSLIDEFYCYGGKSISVFGGEPLLSQMVFPILKYARSKGLNTSITTNGILFNNSSILSEMYECKPNQIMISIMAVGDKYGTLHGKDYYGLLIEGVKKLLTIRNEDDLDISFHMTLQKDNYDQLPSIVLLASQLGIKKISFQYVSAISTEINEKTEKILGAVFNNDMCHWNIDRQLLLSSIEIDDCVDSVRTAIEVADSLNILLNIDPIFYLDNTKEILSTGCFGAREKCNLNSIIVLPNGLIGACPMLQHYIIGDVNNQKLPEIVDGDAFVKLKNLVENGFFLPICDYCCNHSMFYKERKK